MSWVPRVLSELLARGPGPVTLDDIADAIGIELATPREIEMLFDELEARGAAIVEPVRGSLTPMLRGVLAAARHLRATGQPAELSRIAEAAGLTKREVRVALLYGEVLSRG